MAIVLDQKLRQLSTLKRAALRSLRQELFGQSLAPGVRREVLLRILAFRLQERAFGGIKPSTARRLRAIAEETEARRRSNRVISVKAPAGSRMVREWHGRLHEVATLDEGYEYAGK